MIRTLGGATVFRFLMDQSAYCEFWFCEALWPDFQQVDFIRALRDRASRQRRIGPWHRAATGAGCTFTGS